jgi:peptidoglycan hydrolase CwlO-like protein
MEEANILARFSCNICNKKYRHRPSLSRHRKECLKKKIKEEKFQVIKIEETIKHLQKQVDFYRKQAEHYFKKNNILEEENSKLKAKIKAYES